MFVAAFIHQKNCRCLDSTSNKTKRKFPICISCQKYVSKPGPILCQKLYIFWAWNSTPFVQPPLCGVLTPSPPTSFRRKIITCKKKKKQNKTKQKSASIQSKSQFLDRHPNTPNSQNLSLNFKLLSIVTIYIVL
jgi:hypothetical protein